MFINSYGQPTLLYPENKHLNLEEFKKAPLLLCHKDDLIGKHLPEDWNGCLYTSEVVCQELENAKYKFPPNGSYKKVALLANETFNVDLHKGNTIKLTMIPLANNLIYIIKDKLVNNIATENFTADDLYMFAHNKVICEHISKGIDVLYINDAAYNEDPHFNRNKMPNSYPSKFLLKSLIKLVQPVVIKGLWGCPLPQSVLNYCVQN